MKVSFFNSENRKKTCVNKDFMGGYGWVFNAGNSLPARMINLVKALGEHLPIMSFVYLASILHDKGHNVEYSEDTVNSADMVIMHSSMVDYNSDIEWARRFKKEGKSVGFIGPFANAVPEAFLEDCDFIIKGEPEEAIYKIADGLNPKGIIESSPIPDLDKLPFPKWELFPYKRYSYFPALKEKPFLPILSSRGCPHTCNYCPYPVAYAWRNRSPKNVLDEIGYLIDSFGMKTMLFRDPIFSMNRKRTMEIITGILERGYKIKWACETRLDAVDKELLTLMHKAGLRVINVGVESHSDDIIRKASRKPIKQEHQEAMIKYCDELGIRVTVFYMFGMPDDTKMSLLNTIKYAKKLNTHVAQFFIFTPFPGTKYYDSVKENIYEKNWEKFDCYTPVFKHKNLSKDEILKLKEKAFVSYYYRPAWALKLIQRIFKDVFDGGRYA